MARRDASGCRKDVTNGNDNGMDGQTDRVRRNMRPPPREEGRIINRQIGCLSSNKLFNSCADPNHNPNPGILWWNFCQYGIWAIVRILRDRDDAWTEICAGREIW